MNKIIKLLKSAPLWSQPFIGLSMGILLIALVPILAPIVLGWGLYTEIAGMFDDKR
jgi:hypothetical protein